MLKLFSSKSFYFLIAALFLIIFPALVAFASVPGMQPSYDSLPGENVQVLSQQGDATILNTSNKKIFVPNKTYVEWDKFIVNTPPYVNVFRCGDGICQDSEKGTCKEDCPAIGEGCGDGRCGYSYKEVTYATPKQVTQDYRACEVKTKWWVWVPVINAIVAWTSGLHYFDCNTQTRTVTVYKGVEKVGEVWQKSTDANIAALQEECKDDCQAPAGSGCGVCGYDSSGAQCPNNCSNGGYNQIDCVYKQAETINTGTSDCAIGTEPMISRSDYLSAKKYFTASEAAAASIEQQADYRCASQTYTLPARYECSFANDTSRLCAAGKFCPATGGLIPVDQKFLVTTLYANAKFASSECVDSSLPGMKLCNTTMNCPPGHFCKVGSFVPKKCPGNTYSTGGAAQCESCPVGTMTLFYGATGSQYCVPAPYFWDGVCDTSSGETPTNSKDCPDINQVGSQWANDGRCTGMEDMINNPNDCKCGDGDCNNNENLLSCPIDCACMDNVCGTGLYKSGRWIYYKEGKYCKSNGQQVLNPSLCGTYMNSGEVCGNKICEPGERYNTTIKKVVCLLDCQWEDFCGDGSCTGKETRTSCPADCKCGNGICESNESAWSCSADCHCGNGKCELEYNESPSNCSSDCRCGDRVCSFGEVCSTDCNNGCVNDQICGPDEAPTCLDCKEIKPLDPFI